MTKLATRSEKLSDVLAWELAPEYGYCRTTATVAVEAGMDVGAVVVLSGGKYVWVKQADVATLGNDVRIVIDADVNTKAAGDASLTLLGNAAISPAQVNRAGLKFKNTLSAGEVDTVVSKLAAKGIFTTVRV